MNAEALAYQNTQQELISKSESLDTTYSIGNEIRFLQRNPHLTHAQKRYYCSEQMYKFLDEHAGRIPYSRIPGRLTQDGRLEFCGVDMNESWKQIVDIKGKNSREGHEVEGYRRAQEMLQNGARAVVISSAQLQGVDRRFTFILTKDTVRSQIEGIEGTPISQLCVLHEGEDLSFENAQHQYSALEFLARKKDHEAYSFSHGDAMLRRPIAFTSGESATLSAILKNLHIGDDEIAASKHFQRAVKKELAGDINAFVTIIQQLASYEAPLIDGGQFNKVKTLLKKAEMYRDGIYNAARIIRQRFDSPYQSATNTTRRYQQSTNVNDRMHYFSTLMKAEIQGGVSCPAALKTSKSPFEVSSGLSSGKTMSEIMEGNKHDEHKDPDRMHCPMCNRKVRYKIDKEEQMIYCLESGYDEDGKPKHRSEYQC